MSNRLANETSPYLLQHAHNPVDWYPWGAEAFERARRENKPILLSIGYSACHWCHVMERESFEDEPTARLMNDLFVNVKVDREERPDVDSIYMQAVQAMTGHGGWPMTTFLTPELVPYWGGTYFPPTDRQGMPSFRRVLAAVSDAYRNKPEDVERVAQSMRQMYATTKDRARSSGTLSADLLDRATRGLLAQYDPVDGGFGDAPKFPQSMAMEFLLQQWARTGHEAALEAVRHTFRQMARGGIHDQIGGGFSRYSVDAGWLVPHFEKMLYDNALLLRVGTHLLQIGDDPDARRELADICLKLTAWLREEMTSPAGGFYSALDADSEGHEGKFYVWTDTELRELLGSLADEVLPYWGVSAGGNFEGTNILHVADTRKRPRPERLTQAGDILRKVRSRRVRPARDDKILASWNGLMLRAIAEFVGADRTTYGRGDLARLALANGEFLFREMVRDGRVLRSHKDGVSRITGFLEDYAAVGLGFLALYELTFDRVWLERSRDLAVATVQWFWDDGADAFFDTPSDHEELITRPRDVTDNATPSGTSLAIELLLRVGDVLGVPDMRRRAQFALDTLAEPMARYPLAFGHALVASHMALHGAVEVAIVGERGAADFEQLATVASGPFIPFRVLAGGHPSDEDGIALLENREMRAGAATAYVCRDYVCDRPTADPRELWEQLMRASRPTARR